MKTTPHSQSGAGVFAHHFSDQSCPWDSSRALKPSRWNWPISSCSWHLCEAPWSQALLSRSLIPPSQANVTYTFMKQGKWRCTASYTEIHWTRIENFLSLALTPTHMHYGNKQVRFLIHEMRWFIILSSHVNAKYSFPCKMPWIWNVTKITDRGKKRLCSKVFCLELKWHILINDG